MKKSVNRRSEKLMNRMGLISIYVIGLTVIMLQLRSVI